MIRYKTLKHVDPRGQPLKHCDKRDGGFVYFQNEKKIWRKQLKVFYSICCNEINHAILKDQHNNTIVFAQKDWIYEEQRYRDSSRGLNKLDMRTFPLLSLSSFNAGGRTSGVNFTKLCAPSKKSPAHSFRQKIRRLVSPTLCHLQLYWAMANFCWILTNFCAINQTTCTKNLSSCLLKKIREKMLMKSTPKEKQNLYVHCEGSISLYPPMDQCSDEWAAS